MKRKVKFYKWVGEEKEFIPGVPPRDMEPAEVEQRGIENIVKKSGKFKPVYVKKENS